ncbi:LADA_0B02564g1_1 [Lachancea dasiensis]|uniref:LADA_0B02564g1_1 n=1 Tax=Lachancea dasiensis TaxID=1072105 RepID=A0A1G4ISA2_9SACH|nr:LADA_0B02564g1_1 [Lachancea dasiensis]
MASVKSTSASINAEAPRVENSISSGNLKESKDSSTSLGSNREQRSFSGKEKTAPVSSRPISRSPKDGRTEKLNRSVSVKSINPLKKIFHRSQSHHDTADRSRHVAGSVPPQGPTLSSDQRSRNRSSSFLQRMHGQQHPPASQASHVLRDKHHSASFNNSKAHNVNPFVSARHSPFESPFSALGKGSDIAAPRQSHANASNPISRRTSSNESNMVYNPYGTLSKNDTSSSHHDLSFYLQDGKDELPLLPTPLKDPNDYLPEGYKQFSVQLLDNFVYPEKNSADDIHLGSGGSSDVRTIKSAFHKKELYALKKFKLLRNEKPEHFYERCSKEFIMAKKLSSNPHIANTFYLVKVSTTTSMTRGWAFIVEYCSGGDLFSLIMRQDWRKRPLQEKYEYWRQIVEGIKFIHSQGIVHRDIKPENVLITKEGLAKLTDFGISDWGHEDPDEVRSPVKLFDTYVGSPPYTSPEVMAFKDENATKQDKKPYDAHGMDCWALGIMLFTLVYQSTPFMEAYKTDSRYRSYVLSYDNFVDHNNPHFKKSGNYKPGPGSEFQFGREFQNTGASRVAWRLVDPDVKTRYTIEDILADPWWESISAHAKETSIPLPKMPELRNSSYDNTLDSSFLTAPSSAKSSSEELIMQHTSNPFLNNNKSKSKSMLSIVEDNQVPSQSPVGDSLPTLNEEKATEDGDEGGLQKVEAADDDSTGEANIRNLSLGKGAGK